MFTWRKRVQPFSPVAMGTLWSDALHKITLNYLIKYPACSIVTPNSLQHPNICSCRYIQGEIGMLSEKKALVPIILITIMNQKHYTSPPQHLNVIIHHSVHCRGTKWTLCLHYQRHWFLLSSAHKPPTHLPPVGRRHRHRHRIPATWVTGSHRASRDLWPTTELSREKPASVITWRIFRRRRLRRSLKSNNESYHTCVTGSELQDVK